MGLQLIVLNVIVFENEFVVTPFTLVKVYAPLLHHLIKLVEAKPIKRNTPAP